VCARRSQTAQGEDRRGSNKRRRTEREGVESGKWKGERVIKRERKRGRERE